MDDLLERLEQPFQSLPDALDRLLHLLIDRLGLRLAEIELAGGARYTARPAALQASGRRRSRRVGSVDDAVRAAEWLQASDGQMKRRVGGDVALPLEYAGRALGSLRLGWRERGGPRRPSETSLRDLARQSARLLHRYQARDWAQATLGAPLVLVGASRALQDAEAMLERVAATELPVLLHGEAGTEAAHFAAMIHAGGDRRHRAFVAIDCDRPQGSPADWMKRAQGGTLFLEGVESMSRELQGELAGRLRPELAPWPPAPAAADVRVIAATAADLRSEAAAGRFASGLLERLDVLALRIPPLRERPEDVPALVAAALARRGYRSEAKRTAALMELFCAYAWPENLVELERVVLRLAVMTGDQPIREEDVLRFTPWVSRAWRQPAREAAAFQAARAAVGAAAGVERARSDRWVDALLRGDVQPLARLHEGLRRALIWLADHAAEPVSLDELARVAHVSPSHLTFLFRTHLGVSFKTLLSRLRVERAKQIFAEAPGRRVTEVAMTVGFSDLSHFERTFRRLVGQSPREFRRAVEAGAAE